MTSTTRHVVDHGCPGCTPPALLAAMADVRTGLRARPAAPRPRRRGADLVVRGRIVTMDPERPTADALAVRDGRIVAVGTTEEVDGHAAPGTEVLELGDAVCYPGFVEPHMHLWATALFQRFVDCSPLTHDTHDEVLADLAEAGEVAGPGEWVCGKLWDPSLFPDAPELDRDLLDRLVPDGPALVVNASMHFAYLNSRALEVIELHDDSPDPDGGFLGRRDGRLTGVLGELPAIFPALRAVPQLGHDALLDALVDVAHVAAAAGVTKVHDAGSGSLFGSAELDLLRELADADRLPVRVSVALLDSARRAVDGLHPGAGDEMVRATSWKLITDGSNQGRSGHLRQPYLGSEERGEANYATDDLVARMTRAVEEGWQLMVHANGDAALDQALDAYEALVAAVGPQPERRHRIEHSSLATDEHFARMAALGVSPSFLMNHVYYWGRALRDDVLGPDRAATLDSCASALRHDLRISLHSDFNVSPIAPLRSVQTAVTRVMRDGGDVLNPDERITVEQALRAVTIDAAWQTHVDDEVGSLEVGKRADLVLLSADPQQVAPDEIAAIEVLGTRLAGHPTTPPA